MKISVIFSTYNSPDWLEKVLWGFYYQSDKKFELIVADDGSTQKTKSKITEFEQASGLKVKHVWQDDKGFQKTQILNKALTASSGEYIIFTDGDCIPRKDFVAVHRQNLEPGYFLSGGYFKLPMSTSKTINKSHIETGEAFNPDWLIQHGLKKTYKLLKLTATGLVQKFLNSCTPTKATWNGHNASGWRKDIFAVNGFDERMQYGGEDRELGERLFNLGLKSKQIRYSAICIHLDHSRGYVEPQMLEKNAQIRLETKRCKRVKTNYGIVKQTLT